MVKNTLSGYRIIASDLDDTLLCSDRTICQRNKEAIRRAVELGVKFVCCSGRGYMSFQNTLRELGLYDLPDQYSISFNGSAITENRGNRVLYLESMPWETVNEIYLRGRTYDVCMHIYTQDTVCIYNLNDSEREFLNNRQEYVVIDEPDLSFLRDRPVVKILYEHEGYDFLNPLEEEVRELTRDCEVSYSSWRYLEFNQKGVSKGSGLRRLAQLLGVDLRQTIAIGDNVNDLSMLKDAGLGAGVANAFEGILPYCDYLCEADNDHGGVGEVIEKYVLNAE